jgi:hypothetical protein
MTLLPRWLREHSRTLAQAEDCESEGVRFDAGPSRRRVVYVRPCSSEWLRHSCSFYLR